MVLLNTATGVISKTGDPTSVAVVEIPVENDGLIRSESGSAELDGGSGSGSSVGEYSAAAADATVRFNGGIHRIGAGGSITGPGVTSIRSGTVTGPLAVKAGGILQLEGGTLSAPLNGTGNILIDAGAAFRIVNAAGKTLMGPVRNQGQTVIR